MSHNRKVLKPIETTEQTNCRCRSQCALNGACRNGPIVYRATVPQTNRTEGENRTSTYVGSTQEFKPRLFNHEASFRNEQLKTRTSLSQLIWSENLGPKPTINWDIITRAFTYNKGGRYCDLCLSEALAISRNLRNAGSLNKRNELTNKCLHKMRFRLNRLKHPSKT